MFGGMKINEGRLLELVVEKQTKLLEDQQFLQMLTSA